MRSHQSITPGVNAILNVHNNNPNCEFKFNTVTEDEVPNRNCM